MRLCVLFCVLESTWRITNWRILTFEEERRFHVCCLPPLAYSTQTTELNAKIGQRLNQVSSHIIKDTRRYKIPNLMFLCIQPFFSYISSYFLSGWRGGIRTDIVQFKRPHIKLFRWWLLFVLSFSLREKYRSYHENTICEYNLYKAWNLYTSRILIVISIEYICTFIICNYVEILTLNYVNYHFCI